MKYMYGKTTKIFGTLMVLIVCLLLFPAACGEHVQQDGETGGADSPAESAGQTQSGGGWVSPYLADIIPQEGEIIQWYMDHTDNQKNGFYLDCKYHSQKSVEENAAFYTGLGLTDTMDSDSSANMEGELEGGIYLTAVLSKSPEAGYVTLGEVCVSTMPYVDGKRIRPEDVFDQSAIALFDPDTLLIKQAYSNWQEYVICFYSPEDYMSYAEKYKPLIEKLDEPSLQMGVPISAGTSDMICIMEGKAEDGTRINVRVWEWDETLRETKYRAYAEIKVTPGHAG